MSIISSATPDLALLLPSWEVALRAERKSPATIKAYGDGVRRFLVVLLVGSSVMDVAGQGRRGPA